MGSSQTNAEVAAPSVLGSEAKVDLSRTGRLPVSRIALEQLTSEVADGSSASTSTSSAGPSLPTSPAGLSSLLRKNFSRAGRIMAPQRGLTPTTSSISSTSSSQQVTPSPLSPSSTTPSSSSSSGAAAARTSSNISAHRQQRPAGPSTSTSTALITAGATSSEMKKRQEEYINYLQSPFSFIDKVIESPFTEEFVYLNPHGPYNLTIVKHSSINPNNYYTMSRAGVTHFYQSETDFTSLDQWEREYFLYVKMMDIPFFQQFRSWKAFYFWKKLINKMKAIKYSKVLNENLYTLNKRLCAALIELKRRCMETSNWALLKLDTKQTQTLIQFSEDQEAQRISVAESLARFGAEARRIISTACEQDLRQFLIENGFRKTRDRDGDSKDGSSSMGGGSGLSTSTSSSSSSSSVLGRGSSDYGSSDFGSSRHHQGATSTSGSHEEFPQKISRAEKAAQRTKSKKLAKFIRLADFHIIHTLAALCKERVQDIARLVDRKPPAKTPSPYMPKDGDGNPSLGLPGGRGGFGGGSSGSSSYYNMSTSFALNSFKKKRMGGADQKGEVPLFSIELVLDDHTGELSFRPSLDECLQVIEHAINTAAVKTMSQRRMIQEEQFRDYAACTASEMVEMESHDMHPAALVLENPELIATKQQIRDSLTIAFRAAWEYAEGFLPIATLYLENKAFLRDPIGEVPVSVLSELVTKFDEQARNLEDLRTSVDIGILSVDTAALKKTLVPSPNDCKSKLERHLPLISSKKTQELLEYLNAAHSKISKVPTNVEEFVVVLNFMRNVQDVQDKMNQRFTFISDLHVLMQETQVKIPDTDRQNLDRLTQTRQQFKTTLMLTDASMQANTDRFSKDLESQAPKLADEIEAVEKQTKKDMFTSVKSDRETIVNSLLEIDGVLSEIEAKIARFQQFQDLLGSEPTQFPKLRAARQDLTVKLDLWRTMLSWNGFLENWMTKPFAQVDVEEVTRTITAYNKICGRAKRHLQSTTIYVPPSSKYDHPKASSSSSTSTSTSSASSSTSTSSSSASSSSSSTSGSSQSESSGPSAPSQSTAVADLLRSYIADFSSILPVVSDLRNPKLQDRHWAEINALLNHNVQADPAFCLGTLIEKKAMEHSQQIARVSIKARQEAALQDQLNSVNSKWDTLSFPLLNYKNQKDMYILGDIEDVLVDLDESLVTVNSVLGSNYVEPLRGPANELNNNLRMVQSTLEQWTLCQRQWMYLEPIFTSQDIVRSLPEESTLFMEASKEFVNIMRLTAVNAKCFAACNAAVRDKLTAANEALDKVSKLLENYLETKRDAFPRFYFLASDELIKILSNQKNHAAVQPFLPKCFDNLVKLEFADNVIVGMHSSEGEYVRLGTNIKLRPLVEIWLGDFEKEMVRTVRGMLRRSLLPEAVSLPRKNWILDRPAQAVMTCTQILWAKDAEHAIRQVKTDNGKALQQWYERQLRQLTELTGVVRSPLPKLERSKIVTLITTDVHARDVTKMLVDRKVSNLHDFNWQQQLRFYWTRSAGGEDDCFIAQSNAEFQYGGEYMGVTTRLVITPLTDRCWLTITGALHIRFGASPAGPAGTGKTESVKDLAKALGTLCVVMNCSEQMNYKITEKLFLGLAQTGAWACLDEFNRIDIEVLSVVAQQLLQIRQALLQNLDTFTFQGKEKCVLKHSCGVMITMNPGYAGRTELPDNLKVLFRPVAMMVPDYTMIAENMLFSEGFEQATALAKKMVQLYKLASEQLSQQDHYDFGMRAVKSVLVMAGALKRAEPNLDESLLLIRAMRDSNIPKFLAQDLPLFNAIVQDLFPDVKLPKAENQLLTMAIKDAIADHRLQPEPQFVSKVVQLYDTFLIRFGAMLVGPAGGAKTQCWKTLQTAMSSLSLRLPNDERYKKVHTHVMNPKSVTGAELFGELNELSQEWHDGLASNIFREAVKDTTLEKHWVIFDGPVDALWIENMNTVLDDNMMLCLPNGSRIKLKQEMRVLFEVQDLAAASPATVSRCGMVYLTPNDMGVYPYVRSWLARLTYLSEPVKKYIYTLFQDTLPALFAHIAEYGKMPIPVTDLSRATTVCRLMEVLLGPYARARQVFMNQEIRRQQDAQHAKPASQTDLVDDEKGTSTHSGAGDAVNGASDGSGGLASPDGLMSPSTNTSAARFEDDLTPQWGQDLDSMKVTIDMCYAFSCAWGIGGSLDEESLAQFSKLLNEMFLNVKPPGSFFDVHIDLLEGQWKPWDTQIVPFTYNPKIPFFDILVPTIDTVRYRWLAQTLLSSSAPVFFTGVTGIGKSVILQDMFEQLSTFSSRILDKSLDPPADGSVVLYGTSPDGFFTEENRHTVASSFDFLPLVITFSAQSSSLKTQETIESRLIKLKGGMFGAPQGKRLVVHIDDVNMPTTEKYGAQPPIELLRQVVDYGGFYDRGTLAWKEIDHITLLCSAAPPGGGRSPTTARFLRHFSLFCVPSPSEAVMKKIFSAIYTGWAQQGFSQSIVKLADPIVLSTIDLYQTIAKDLLPTPAKSHYTFNLRDISKVFQGILSIKPLSCSNPETMIRLWVHECQRCFEDRLVNSTDKLWCTQKLAILLSKNFGSDMKHDTIFKKRPIAFCDFMNEGDRMYEEVKEPEKLIEALESRLGDYNAEMPSNQMNLVFFDDAVKHISRIARIIRQPRGNAMLVGVGGSGKQSLTRLACYLAGYKCMQPEVSRNFSYSDFQDFLKKVFIAAGADGEDVVFLFTETQIVQERFLEDVNNLLNSGEVPNLFPKEELMPILDKVAPIVRERGLAATFNVVYSTFLQRVRDHVHVVLCLSPVGDAFRSRLRMFPSLINCCTIDWFTPWPRAALLSVSESVLKDSDLAVDATVVDALANECMEIHVSVEEACERYKRQLRRTVYTTPKSYLDMLSLFKDMYKRLRSKLENRRIHLLTGLKRLKDTTVMVGVLQRDLANLKPSLEAKSRETLALLAEVERESTEADAKRREVEMEERLLSEQAAETGREEAAAADAELKMRPLVKRAEEAAKNVKSSEVAEMRKLLAATPPPQLPRVIEAVCLILNQPPTQDNIKALIASTNFTQKMLSADPTDQNIERCRKYTSDPELNPSALLNVSRAASGMMTWILAVVEKSKIMKEFKPKKEKADALKRRQELAEAELRKIQDELNDVVTKVLTLRERCAQTEEEKRMLDAKGKETEVRLERASQLTSLLADEEKRWAEDADKIQRVLDVLVGDAFLAAACVSYYGAFTGEYRSLLVSQWVDRVRAAGIPVSETFSLQSVLSDPMEINSWCISGLPTDDVSIDSAVCTTEAKRWPLMIDPQGQATKWVKTYYSKNLHVVRMGDDRMIKTLEKCIRNGFPMLIEDAGETIDGSLDPILNHQIFDEGGRMVIRVTDTNIEYNPSFRLYIATKLPNPHYLPEVCIKVTLLNFAVTRKGLEDQLLGEVVRKERADVESKRQFLVTSLVEDRKMLAAQEKAILEMVQASQSSVLDNSSLVNQLKDSKDSAHVLDVRLKQANDTQKHLEEIRAKYVPVAARGSLVYFTISDLTQVDPMYQFSLEFFIRFFNVCIDQAPQSADLNTRLGHLLDYITQSFYNNICRGLFEKHKLTYSFNLMSSILRHRGDVSAVEWSVFVRGPGLQPMPHAPENPYPDEIKANVWLDLCRLEAALPTIFTDLIKQLCSPANISSWKEWITSPRIAELKPPAPFSTLSTFSRLLLVKCVRYEHTLAAVTEFIGSYPFGRGLVTPPQTALADVYKDSDYKTPIIFVLSTGADPTGMLFRFAREHGFADRLQHISLGQGQGDNARKLIAEALSKGDWVLLQNCHLARSWMPELEAIVESFDHEDKRIVPSFRLWLTSMPSAQFPVSVLQRGIKLTNEPPKGLKANMIRSYNNVIRAEELESHPKPVIWKKLAFGLAFFHATVQERKKFGPLGWNKIYEWNDSDLETSLQVLRMSLEENEHVPWDALTYVSGQICYGGRVTDEWDRRCLMAILGQFYTPRIESDQYRFSPSSVYYAPSTGKWSDYMTYLQTLPAQEDPEVFGMNENANIIFLNQEADAVVRTIRSLQPRDLDSSIGKSSDEIVTELAAEMEQKLPPLLDIKAEAGPRTFPTAEDEPEDPSQVQVDSLNEFLRQEIDRYNGLLTVVRRTLVDLQKAIKGLVVMSQDLDYMFVDLLNNRVPELWSKAAPPSLCNLANWMIDFHRRIASIRDWLRNGKPVSYWMPGFFFLHGFLTGVLQTHARRYHIPIDTLSFSYRIMSDVTDPEELKAPADDGVYIHGLYTTGAKWDIESDSLVDSPVGELIPPLPVIHFLPKENYTIVPTDYACPVYQTAIRAGIASSTGQSTNFVVDIHLPTHRDPNYWVLNGVAILCQPDSGTS